MKPEDDETHRLQRWVHRSLLIGLVVSALLLAAGLLAATRVPRPEDSQMPQPIGALVRSALLGEGEALMTLGLLALMATPVIRVGVLAAGWSVEGELRFAAVAAAVLILLGASLYLGMG